MRKFPLNKKVIKYESIQIDGDLKQEIKDYVNTHGFKLGKFVEIMFHAYMSGSTAHMKE